MDHRSIDPVSEPSRLRRVVRRNPWLWLIVFILVIQAIPRSIIEHCWGKRTGDLASLVLVVPGTLAGLYCLSCVRENAEAGE